MGLGFLKKGGLVYLGVYAISFWGIGVWLRGIIKRALVFKEIVCGLSYFGSGLLIIGFC